MNPALTRAGGRVNSALRDNNEEIRMKLLGKTAIVLGMAGVMAIGSMTASEARWRAGPAAAVGFVAGAAVGAAAANANSGYYSGSGGYGYDSYASGGYGSGGYGSGGYGYDSYAYEPAASYEPAYTSPSYYGPVRSYDTNYTGPWMERRLQGRDW